MVRQAHQEGADIIELRLDTCLRDGADGNAILADLVHWPLPTLVTNRDQSEGGHFDGSLNKRLEWLKQADLAHAAYIDVEFAFWEHLTTNPNTRR